MFDVERGGTSQRESKSRADQKRARNTCTERGGSTASKKKGEKIKSLKINEDYYNHALSVQFKALPYQGTRCFYKAGFFYSDWRRSCGEPEGQIPQIR